MKENWEEEFDTIYKEFPKREDLKSFIYSLLDTQKKEIIEKIEKMKRVCDGFNGCGRSVFTGKEADCGSAPFKHTFIEKHNKTLDEAIQKIKDKLK